MIRATIVVCCTALALGVTAGCELKSARFQATVYETRVPEKSVSAFDAASLAANTGPAADLQKALSACGKTKVLYQVDQTINLAEDHIRISNREPFVTNARRTERGPTIKTVQYEEVGVIFQIAGKPAGAGLDATVGVEMSALTDSAKQITENVSAVTVRSIALGHKGPIQLGKPVVLVSLDASSRDADGNAIAYVCRIVFSKPAS